MELSLADDFSNSYRNYQLLIYIVSFKDTSSVVEADYDLLSVLYAIILDYM